MNSSTVPPCLRPEGRRFVAPSPLSAAWSLRVTAVTGGPVPVEIPGGSGVVEAKTAGRRAFSRGGPSLCHKFWFLFRQSQFCKANISRKDTGVKGCSHPKSRERAGSTAPPATGRRCTVPGESAGRPAGARCGTRGSAGRTERRIRPVGPNSPANPAASGRVPWAIIRLLPFLIFKSTISLKKYNVKFINKLKIDSYFAINMDMIAY